MTAYTDRAIANQGCASLPPTPVNGTLVQNWVENLPGATVTFLCSSVRLQLTGATGATCLRNGSWAYTGGSGPPSCGQFQLQGRTAAFPGTSCKAIYRFGTTAGLNVTSGPYWLQPNPLAPPQQIYCDMTTPARDGLRGFTLCGKYDGRSAGSRYLLQGFARSNQNPADMTSLDSFTGLGASANQASIDCRQFIGLDTQWMMHLGTNDTSPDYVNGTIRFTNILSCVSAFASASTKPSVLQRSVLCWSIFRGGGSNM
eukprot:m.414362 g.414362  ORF g.414362 m.414362 type:complete len:257 (-) comp21269_c0_seq14:127-897(-)